MSDNPTRQDPDTMGTNAATSEQANRLRIEMLEKESGEFLDPNTIESTLDLVNKDIDFLEYLQGLITRKTTRLISLQAEAQSRFYAAEIQILRFKRDTISKSMERFTSTQSITSIKPEQNTNISENSSESQSSTSQSKSVTPSMDYRMTKLSRESSAPPRKREKKTPKQSTG